MTQLFQRILCPTDFSTESVRALHAAEDLARRHGGTVLVIHVVDALRQTGDMVVTLVSEANLAMDTLMASERSRLPDVQLTGEVTSGEPFSEILERAASWPADLVVMAPAGPRLAERILGSTSERVLRNAACSVMVVRGIAGAP